MKENALLPLESRGAAEADTVIEITLTVYGNGSVTAKLLDDDASLAYQETRRNFADVTIKNGKAKAPQLTGYFIKTLRFIQ